MARVIDEYVTSLRERLRGPEHVKEDLLAEARDSLDDAAAAYRSGGLAEEAAQRRAVADFGPAAVIAREYQGLLALAHGARTLRTLLLVPVAHLGWELNRGFWVGAWPRFDVPPPDWYLAVARANDSAAWVVAAVAVASLLAGRWLVRRGVAAGTLARLAGAVSAVSVAAVLSGNLAIMTATALVDAARLALPPPVAAATLVPMAIALRLAVLARRCLLLTPAS
ncbi:permease prefix domain 1-containing protein [Saccharothrix coeruleofusca]|uniref:Uncharacterized protein n=1 Tax=Saccharothrix coeruleofusca TaxID=33919 RepID=A0A918AMD1_9PSEU|nr:permease prefix domain 1-containing protein [Saccharothrix coeruleofusca]GGP60707.1 hypothetical protein GCM10010185_36450 [Saccharothrix coeruleofusca]